VDFIKLFLLFDFAKKSLGSFDVDGTLMLILLSLEEEARLLGM